MTDLLLAIRFLTRLPTPPVDATPERLARAMRWAPLVGLLVGGFVLAGAAAGRLLGAGVGAASALLLWVWVTGALHLDGVGDLADAIGGSHGHDPARLRQILHDPHVGSFAVVAIGLLLLGKFALLQALLGSGPLWPLLLVPAIARMLPLWWARRVPPLHEGLGSRLGAGVGWGAVLLWGVALGLLLPWLPAAAVVLLFAPVWGWWVRRRIGGMSGDSHGAGIELAEALLLLAILGERALG